MNEQQRIDEAIDHFAAAMKARMRTKRKAGWQGWDRFEYPGRLLMKAAAVNGSPKSAVDCANFCMMTWLRHTP